MEIEWELWPSTVIHPIYPVSGTTKGVQHIWRRHPPGGPGKPVEFRRRMPLAFDGWLTSFSSWISSMVAPLHGWRVYRVPCQCEATYHCSRVQYGNTHRWYRARTDASVHESDCWLKGDSAPRSHKTSSSTWTLTSSFHPGSPPRIVW